MADYSNASEPLITQSGQTLVFSQMARFANSAYLRSVGTIIISLQPVLIATTRDISPEFKWTRTLQDTRLNNDR